MGNNAYAIFFFWGGGEVGEWEVPKVYYEQCENSECKTVKAVYNGPVYSGHKNAPCSVHSQLLETVNFNQLFTC